MRKYLYVSWRLTNITSVSVLGDEIMKKGDQRLKKLKTSKFSQAQNREKYCQDLVWLAQEIADVNAAKKESKFFKALADEKRIRILKLLTLREMCVCELTVALDVTQPNLSQHLKILENECLVNRRKEGKWAHYSLTKRALIEKLFGTVLLHDQQLLQQIER